MKTIEWKSKEALEAAFKDAIVHDTKIDDLIKILVDAKEYGYSNIELIVSDCDIDPIDIYFWKRT